jgi:hypothetical protein
VATNTNSSSAFDFCKISFNYSSDTVSASPNVCSIIRVLLILPVTGSLYSVPCPVKCKASGYYPRTLVKFSIVPCSD